MRSPTIGTICTYTYVNDLFPSADGGIIIIVLWTHNFIFVSYPFLFRFGSSTARYATFLTVGVIFAELATNGLTDMLWEANNYGKTYQQVDWSKFDPQDDEEEEEDDDDDDDDE